MPHRAATWCSPPNVGIVDHWLRLIVVFVTQQTMCWVILIVTCAATFATAEKALPVIPPRWRKFIL